MREMQQNDTYDESELPEDMDLESEGEEDTSTNMTTIFGLPVKMVVLAGAAVLLFVIAIMVFMLRSDNSKDDIVYPNSSVYVDTPATSANSSVECYVHNIYVGTTSDNSMIYDDSGNLYNVITSTGNTPVTDLFGNILGYVYTETASSDSASNSSYSDSPAFDSQTIETLRKYGYTGDEIELAAETGMNAEEMIAKAQALQDEAAKEALKRMSDHASEEFQQIINSTQYCMPEQVYVAANWQDEGYVNETGSFIVNSDYEKIPNYGYQLRIKVKIANSTYVFMDVSPQRYMSMPDSGNIVVQVSYQLWGPSQEDLQFYVTEVTERDITNLTTNPQDSATNLSDIISR